ncbi:hypothetical protein PG991_010933 [Apiospora marii]|uniref:Coenzyme Q-binding protein COQ10 START domain-containing protein n=1 Tax=Apiospora marii TaxID=335849 RepID=A0ABR1RCN4_9PEZI
MDAFRRAARVAATGIAGTVAGTGLGVAYLAASTTLITPIPRDDALWQSKTLKKLNHLENPVLADICIKRIPLSKIRPELAADEAALTAEFARGVWSGWGEYSTKCLPTAGEREPQVSKLTYLPAFEPQRWLFTKIYRTPENSHLRFSRREIAGCTFELGTEFIDQFEVVERSRHAITVREGGSPRDLGPREVDGLITTTAKIDREAGEVELTLSTRFFKGGEKVTDGSMPVPYLVERLHYIYARALVQSGSSALR